MDRDRSIAPVPRITAASTVEMTPKANQYSTLAMR
jgi:hypothetical protein